MERVFRLIEYISISSGMAIAVGCYMAIGQMSTELPLAMIPLSVVVAGVICMFAAASIAKLARLYPTSVGIRAYIKAAFGESVSVAMTLFLLNIVCIFSGIEAFLLSNVLHQVWAGLNVNLVTLLAMPAIAVLNVLGMELPRKYQIFATFTLISGMLGLSWYAIAQGQVTNPVQISPEQMNTNTLNAFVKGVVLSIFLFIGFEWVTPLGRIKADYNKLIPLSMLIAIFLLMITYASFSYSLSSVNPALLESLSNMPHLALGIAIDGHTGLWIMVLLSLLALSTTLNAGLLGSSRLVYALAREGVLPPTASKISIRFGTPVNAILFMCLLSLFYVLIELYFDLHGLAIILCVSGYSLIYSVLILSAARVTGRTEGKVQRSELASNMAVANRSKWFGQEYFLALLFLVLALSSALSDAQYGILPLLVLLFILSVCFGVAKRQRIKQGVLPLRSES